MNLNVLFRSHVVRQGKAATTEESRDLSALDVGGEVDLLGQLRDVHLEPLLDRVEGLGVRLVGHKGDG